MKLNGNQKVWSFTINLPKFKPGRVSCLKDEKYIILISVGCFGTFVVYL